MTPQEREVITGIFDRLKGAATQQRDPEAERYIADLVRQQPYATYALAQSVYVQEQALDNMQAEIEQLRGEIAQLQQAAQQAAQQAQQQQTGGGSFLGGLFGGGARSQAPAAPAAQPGPWNRQPAGGMPMQAAPEPQPAPSPWSRAGAAPAQAQAPAQQGGGSGFLGSALTTAAGVAGGMVVGNMLMNAFKGGSGHGQGGQNAQQSSDFQPFANRDEAERHAAQHDQGQDDDEEDDEDGDYGDDGDYGNDTYEA